MKNSIAIIGVSFDLPKIKNWKDLEASLSNKDSFIREMPRQRLKEIQEAFGPVEMARVGYLDQIDLFDNEYFGYTERESLRTFPEHRLFLTNAIRAFYHAGYNEASLKKSKTGIFYTASKSVYDQYAKVANVSFNNFDFVKGIEATKLAKYLDLRGPVMSINTSCSSSLVAINAAKHSLHAGECDMAIVGGVKTLALTKDAAQGNVVHSKTGHCRPFDKDADGMLNGEGAIFFVLKRYEQAVKDGDVILAEIKGVGINHGGDRISSLTAPNSEAQKEVLVEAWKNAEVTPNQIRYIEAHGTGTILGDPIEVAGIKEAIAQSASTEKNMPCALSSFKGQVGHLDYLSGLAGLLRVVAALNFRKIPVQANFKQLNEHVTLEDTDLYIPQTSEPWTSESAERIGGLSSFGMTGTNVHLVVAKTEVQMPQKQATKSINYVQISHQNNEKLAKYKKYLAEHIKTIDDLDTIHVLAAKLNKIFQVDKVNQGIVYTSKTSLLDTLTVKKQVSSKARTFLLLDLEVLDYSKNDIQTLLSENKLIRKIWESTIGSPVQTIENEYALSVLFQYCWYKYLFKVLGCQLQFITPREDTVMSRLLKGKLSISEVIENYKAKEKPKIFNEQAFKKHLKNNFPSEEIVLIDFSNKNKNRFNDLRLRCDLIDDICKDAIRFSLYKMILEAGANPLETDLTPVYHDLELPYFSPKRFWPTVTTKQMVQPMTTTVDLEKIKSNIRKSWTTVLETEDFKDEDDFFDIGGTSLEALDMIDELEQVLSGVKISYEDIYSYATVNKLGALLFEQLNPKTEKVKQEAKPAQGLKREEAIQKIRSIWSSILELEDFENEDDFFEIGGTSIEALDMLDDIAQQLNGLQLSYEDIYTYSTVNKLVDKVMTEQADVESAHVESETMQSFDVSLRAANYQKLITKVQESTITKRHPEHIFLTGSTGLLGAEILDYLIKNTSATIYCLVRSKENISATKRFWPNYGDYHEIKKVQSRVKIVAGDLYEPNLGLIGDDKQWKQIDMIIHTAGSPQFVSGKTVDRHINFVGTKHVVDWANQHAIKKLSFVSTIGVVGKIMPPEVRFFYETDTNLGQQSGSLIHGASKLKAEEYINTHYQYSYKIFRIPNLGGRYRDGCFATDLNKNLMWQRLKSLSKLKFYCKELLEENSGVGYLPVDVAAESIAEISFTDIDALNVFHLLDKAIFTNGDLLNALSDIGISAESVSYQTFMNYINNDGPKMNFHQVAVKEKKHSYKDTATTTLMTRLKLDTIKNVDRTIYLKRLIQENLKINNIKVAL